MINIILDGSQFFLSEEVIKRGDLQCIADSYLIVSNEMGGLFQLYYSASILFYSFSMWYIFYNLPFKYKLVAFRKRGMENMAVGSFKQSKSLIVNDM